MSFPKDAKETSPTCEQTVIYPKSHWPKVHFQSDRQHKFDFSSALVPSLLNTPLIFAWTYLKIPKDGVILLRVFSRHLNEKQHITCRVHHICHVIEKFFKNRLKIYNLQQSRFFGFIPEAKEFPLLPLSSWFTTVKSP